MLIFRIPQLKNESAPPPEAPQPTTETAPERPALASTRFARSLSLLSVSWINGRIEAVGVHKGRVTGTWSSPDAIDDAAQVGRLLKEAAVRTDFPGTAVSLVISHPRLNHQLVETPPAKGPALAGLVKRQVSKLKVFDGEAAWSYQPSLPTKNAQAVLVHLFPQKHIEELSGAASESGLRLLAVYPVTPILQDQIAALRLKPNDVGVVVAEMSGMITVVVGRADGQVLMCRALDAARPEAGAGLGVDLNRTVLYVSQQFGVSVSSVWLFGHGLAARQAELQTQIQVPVRVSPESPRPTYWAEESARRSIVELPNLLTREQRQEPQRQILFRMTALLTALITIAGVAWLITSEILIHREKRNVQVLQRRITELEDTHRVKQSEYAVLGRKEQMARAVLTDRPDPAVVWFLGYVADVTPPELVLTNVSVRLHQKHWDFSVGGVLQGMTNDEPVLVLSNAVSTLGERIRGGPFFANPTGRGAVVASTNAVPKVVAEPNLGSLANWSTRSITNAGVGRTGAGNRNGTAPSGSGTARTGSSRSGGSRPVDRSFLLEGYIQ